MDEPLTSARSGCEMGGCGQVANAKSLWRGSNPGSVTRSAVLCKEHTAELWEKVKPSVTVGHTAYLIWPVDKPLPPEWLHRQLATKQEMKSG